MSEETKKTAPAVETEQQPAAAPEATAEQAAPAQEPAAEEAADPKDDKKKDGGWFNKKAREMEAVKAKLDAAEQNAAQAKEQLLRMAAEYDNYRKRSTREADQKFNDGISFAVNQIIPILDTLDMAANAPTTDENYKKGVVMTLDKAAKALEALHVEEIEALGKPFDPNFMNAVQQIPAPDVGMIIFFAVRGGFNIVYDTDGGSEVAARKVRYGEFLTEPETPYKPGYTFDGWYTEKEGETVLWYFQLEKVTQRRRSLYSIHWRKFDVTACSRCRRFHRGIQTGDLRRDLR